MASDALSWLNSNRDYTSGLQILRSAGVSDFLLDVLESGPDNFNTPTLLEEISNLVKIAPINSPEEPLVNETTTDLPVPKEFDSLEKKIRLDQQIRDLFKEITHVHGQLSVLPEGERLFEAAYLVLTTDLKKQRLWDQLHYYKNNGHWFDELAENKPKPEDLEQEIKNAMANRSKAKGNLKNPLPAAKKEYYQAIVADWTKVIDGLRSQRNAS
jgi:hypothetical protein